MQFYTIYLSGGMQKYGKENFDKGNKWRIYCKKALEEYESKFKVNIINPNNYFNFFDEPRYIDQNEVMRFDIHKLRKSDLVVVNFNDKWSLGTMSEIAIAYDRNIPIIGLNENNQPLHPWQFCMCERIFDDIDEMIEYIEDFYLR